MSPIARPHSQGHDPAMSQAEVKPSSNDNSTMADSIQYKAKPKKHGLNVLVMDSAPCWIISFAVFVIYCLASAFNRALTISFLDFVRIFDVSITTTSLSFTFQLVAISLSSLLVMNIMVPMTGERVAVLTGCIGNCLCTIGVGLAPNISVFLFCMGLKGLCIGTSFVPAISMISQYFEQRRSLATAMAYCGMGVGSMAAPPLVEYFKEQYGFKGMFMIVAALEMNSIAAAMLLRPLSCYKYVISSSDADSEEGEDVDEDSGIEEEKKEAIKTLLLDEIKQGDSKLVKPSGINGTGNKENPGGEANKYTESQHGPLNLRDETSNVYEDTTVPLLQQNNAGHRPMFMTQLSMDSRVDSNRAGHKHFTPDVSRSLQNNSVLVEETDNSHHNALTPTTGRRRTNSRNNGDFHRGISQPGSPVSGLASHHRSDSRHLSTSAWSIAGPPMSEVTLDVEVIAMENSERRSHQSGLNHTGNSHTVLRSRSRTVSRQDSAATGGHSAIVDEEEDGPSCWGKTCQTFKDMFSKELLRTWSMRMLLLSAATGSLVQYLLAYLPTLASKQGMDASQVSMLLTVSGAVDLVSRIGIGFFSDMRVLTPAQIVAIANIVIGTTIHFVRFFTDYSSLMFLSVIVGLFGGTRQNLGTLITIEFMGFGLFRRALGFQAMFSTLSLAVHHPMLSAILEATGSFSAPLHYVGVILYASAIFCVMAPLAKRLDAKNDASRQQQQHIS